MIPDRVSREDLEEAHARFAELEQRYGHLAKKKGNGEFEADRDVYKAARLTIARALEGEDGE